jgi:hypothetical protein
MGAPEEGLTKVFVELPEGAPFETESFWAKPLGDDLYELRNSPWFAFDLHFYDVVRANAEEPGAKPKIIEVVHRSGHKTLRVLFSPEISESDQAEMLKSLNRWRGFYEHYQGNLYAVDVEPDGDYQTVCDVLWGWEQEGKLTYETGMTSE